MAGTLHARRARGSVRRMRTALSTLAEYARANPRSQAEHERALKLFPSGLTHDARRQDPFPPCVTHAEGAYKWDVDGHRILDYVTGHGAMVAGHSHPAVVEAVRRQAGLGQHLGASSEQQADWAERIVASCRAPSACASRPAAPRRRCSRCASRAASPAATACSSSPGHFHGWHDDAIPGVSLPVDPAAPLGSARNPDLTVVDPFAPGALERELERGDVACVILEPTGAAWGAVPLPPERVGAHRRGRARQRCAGRVRRGRDRLPLVARGRAGRDRRHARPHGARQGRRRRPAGRRADRAGGRDGGARLPRGRVQGRASRHAQRASALGRRRHRDARPAGRRQRRWRRRTRVAEELRTALCAAFEQRSTPGYAYGQASTFCLIAGERTDDPVTLKRGVPEPLLSALQCAMLLEGVHLFHGCGLLSIAHGADEVELTAGALDARARTPPGRGPDSVTHDLVVAGGHVLCPATGADGIADVGIDDGRIAASARASPAASGSRPPGCWSSPG